MHGENASFTSGVMHATGYRGLGRLPFTDMLRPTASFPKNVVQRQLHELAGMYTRFGFTDDDLKRE